MNTDKPGSLPGSIVTLLITVAVGMAAGHVLTIERVYEPLFSRAPDEESSPYPAWPAKRPLPTPLLRSNDRSRWCTIRALVDTGTYVIGKREHLTDSSEGYRDSGIVFEDGWTSVDKVLRPDTQEFYSSKPPFLPTLMAGEYWLLKHGFGWSLGGEAPSRWWVVRVILLTVNVVPLAIYLVLLDRLCISFGASDWGRLFVLFAACFGTIVTSFVGALNNHTIATCSIVFALAPAWRVLFGPANQDHLWRYAVAGFFAAFAACSDLPAASFAVGLLLLMAVHSPGKTLTWFVPAAAVPVIFFFACNYQALGQLRPAYSELGGEWYVYPGSNFNPFADLEKRRGVDWAREQESRPVYVLNSLVGHHGIFSLTPVWFLAAAGMLTGTFGRGQKAPAFLGIPPERTLWQRWGSQRTLALLTLLVSIVVVGFYLTLAPRNYGGWTLGPRWLMWLTPLWLLVMLPIADKMACCWRGRAIGSVLMGLSVLSAVVPDGNPWHHPWIYVAWEQMFGPLY